MDEPEHVPGDQEPEALDRFLHWMIFHTTNFCHTALFILLALGNIVMLRHFGPTAIQILVVLFLTIAIINLWHAFICATGDCSCEGQVNVQFLKKKSALSIMFWSFKWWTFYGAIAALWSFGMPQPPYWLVMLAVPYLSFMLANPDRRLEDAIRTVTDKNLHSHTLKSLNLKELKKLKRLANDLLELDNAQTIQICIDRLLAEQKTMETGTLVQDKTRSGKTESKRDG